MIAELFEAQAAATPLAVALRFDGACVTYETLNRRANQLARYLKKHGVRPEVAVGVCLPLGIDLVVAALAVAKAGAVYIGIDDGWPAARISDVLDDSAVATALGFADDSRATLGRGGMLCLKSHASRIAAEPIENLGCAAAPDSLASVTYTSGSTGTPKGVMVTVRSAINRMEWMWRTYPFREGDVALMYRSSASVGFSWDCFGALLRGVPTVIHSAVDPRNPAGIVAASIAHGVSLLTASAGLWEAILDEVERQPAGWPSLRLARTTGEPLRPALLARWQCLFPGAPIVNIYGATECSGSMACDASALDAGSVTRIPVGTPIPHVHAYVVDDQMRMLGIGEVGEVCIGGASVARGYRGRPALTAERFIPSPAGTTPGAVVVRTGDTGCWRADGQLELHGRRDLQVKIRGFRVELEEVETALCACAGVRAAAVRADPTADGVQLIAFLESARESLSLHDLRAALLGRLPAHMVPSALAHVDALPRTATGKIDRPELRSLRGRWLEATAEFAAPATASEVALATIWQDVLGVEQIALDDGFFDLGGHSMTGMRILSRVHDTFGIELPLGALYDAPSVRALATAIDTARQMVTIGGAAL